MSTSTNNLLRKLILLNLNFKVNYWAACKHLGHVDFHKGVKVNCTAFFYKHLEADMVKHQRARSLLPAPDYSNIICLIHRSIFDFQDIGLTLRQFAFLFSLICDICVQPEK